jgi:hypothetical protein
LDKRVHEKSPKSVHEKSPFDNVHEKSPILNKSVHEMSLSTKSLHPVLTRVEIEIDFELQLKDDGAIIYFDQFLNVRACLAPLKPGLYAARSTQLG